MDIRLYEDFNQLKPFFLLFMIKDLEGIVKNQNDLEGVEIENPDTYTEDSTPSPHLPPIEDEDDIIPDNMDMDVLQQEPVVDMEKCFFTNKFNGCLFSEHTFLYGKVYPFIGNCYNPNICCFRYH